MQVRITLGQRMFRVRDDVASGSVVASAVIRPGGEVMRILSANCLAQIRVMQPARSRPWHRAASASRAVRVFDGWVSLKSLEDYVTRPKRLSRRVYALLTPFAQGVSGSFRPHRRMALPRSLFGLVEMVVSVD
jgi:hypothetical protein